MVKFSFSRKKKSKVPNQINQTNLMKAANPSGEMKEKIYSLKRIRYSIHVLDYILFITLGGCLDTEMKGEGCKEVSRKLFLKDDKLEIANKLSDEILELTKFATVNINIGDIHIMMKEELPNTEKTQIIKEYMNPPNVDRLMVFTKIQKMLVYENSKLEIILKKLNELCNKNRSPKNRFHSRCDLQESIKNKIADNEKEVINNTILINAILKLYYENGDLLDGSTKEFHPSEYTKFTLKDKDKERIDNRINKEYPFYKNAIEEMNPYKQENNENRNNNGNTNNNENRNNRRKMNSVNQKLNKMTKRIEQMQKTTDEMQKSMMSLSLMPNGKNRTNKRPNNGANRTKRSIRKK